MKYDILANEPVRSDSRSQAVSRSPHHCCSIGARTPQPYLYRFPPVGQADIELPERRKRTEYLSEYFVA